MIALDRFGDGGYGRTMGREIPLYTLEGVQDADVSTHWYTTEDGLGLSMLRFAREPEAGEDAVLLIHGLTTSTDMFVMPEHVNIVQFLLDSGVSDVWSLDYRMSNRWIYNMAPHRYTMDDIALFDFPPALEIMRRHVGDRRIHVISHCLGAFSFMLSLYGRAVSGLASVTANSVGLTPRVPTWSRVKGRFAPFFIENIARMPYLNPKWSEDPGLTKGKLFSKLVSRFHRECDVPACHMLSLMWGSGWPALYDHDNLHEITHRRGGDLYGPTSMHYYRHVRKSYRVGHAVKFDPSDPTYDALPDDYLTHAREIDTPVLLMSGANNKVFADSNARCHETLRGLGCTNSELLILPGYGHQDVFMGKRNHIDAFPPLLDFMRSHGLEPRNPRPLAEPPVPATVAA